MSEPTEEVEEADREWWDDPGMPWKQKPQRADIACMAWIGVLAVFSLVMLPLRGWLLGRAVDILLAITGSRTSAAALGSLVRVGEYSSTLWVLPLLVGVIMANKFDWVYWWAGKLWGRNLIEVWSGKSERARRRNERAEHFARKYETLALLLVSLPIFPRGVVLVALGSAGTTFKKFFAVSLIASVFTTSGYLALGYWIGEPAVALMEAYSKYLLWLSVAIMVVMVIAYFHQNRSPKTPMAQS
jgi:membrane protein DedA with SNARE-associated domain